MKNKGFSLIEICIGVSLLGIMLSIGAPRIRNYIVAGKNSKAVAVLENFRTASELYYADFGVPPCDFSDKEKESRYTKAVQNLKKYVDAKTYAIIKNGSVPIGGSKVGDKEDDKLTYGGEMKFTFTNPDPLLESDGVYIWFAPTEKQKYDHRGKPWTSF